MDILSLKWLPWLLLAGAGLSTCAGNLLIKHSRLVAKPGFWPMVTSLWFLFSLFFYGISVILFAKSLDKLPISVAYPVLAGFVFLFLSIFSNLFIGEVINIYKIFGMLLIICGIIILSVNK
jgi:multidrug transporter EmrE-like cation transporter